MKVFISGISGTGMGPLALMAKAAGMEVFGTDLQRGQVSEELKEAGVEMWIGPEAQDGKFLREKLTEREGVSGDEGEEDLKKGIDWFVYTSALPEGHPELEMARAAGVKCTKRDDFTAFLVEKLGLKMVAVAGTHGKTTTTAMLIWAAKELGIPAAYIVGTTLGFATAGSYREGDRYFIYEADEYDRNFLKFRPWLAVVPAVSYDHPDIYATQEEYTAAFRQFFRQSRKVVLGEGVGKEWQEKKNVEKENGKNSEVEKKNEKFERPRIGAERFRLAGEVRREDAALAATAILEMAPGVSEEEVIEVLDEFPGAGRRFERIAPGIYSDYGHHPEEIAATIEMACEEVERQGFTGLTVIYEPHQNSRQHEVREGYRKAFLGADEILWLPTFLTREEDGLAVLTPEELMAGLENRKVARAAKLGKELAEAVRAAREAGRMVLLLTAGPADSWLRKEFGE